MRIEALGPAVAAGMLAMAAGTSAGAVQRYLNWNECSKGAVIVEKVCGVLVLLGGVYLLYTAR